MSLHEFRLSQALEAQETPFYALIMAAMRQADTGNLEMLRDYWPLVWAELQARYHAPGGRIPADHIKRGEQRRGTAVVELTTEDGIDGMRVAKKDRRLPENQGFVLGMEMREAQRRRATRDRRYSG